MTQQSTKCPTCGQKRPPASPPLDCDEKKWDLEAMKAAAPRCKFEKTLCGIRITELQRAFYVVEGQIFNKLPRRRARAGQRADFISGDGRRYVNYNKKKLAASRLVWALAYGEVPKAKGSHVIDHDNHDRLDNRLENLRVISREENSVRSLHHSFHLAPPP